MDAGDVCTQVSCHISEYFMYDEIATRLIPSNQVAIFMSEFSSLKGLQHAELDNCRISLKM